MEFCGISLLHEIYQVSLEYFVKISTVEVRRIEIGQNRIIMLRAVLDRSDLL